MKFCWWCIIYFDRFIPWKILYSFLPLVECVYILLVVLKTNQVEFTEPRFACWRHQTNFFLKKENVTSPQLDVFKQNNFYRSDIPSILLLFVWLCCVLCLQREYSLTRLGGICRKWPKFVVYYWQLNIICRETYRGKEKPLQQDKTIIHPRFREWG